MQREPKSRFHADAYLQPARFSAWPSSQALYARKEQSKVSGPKPDAYPPACAVQIRAPCSCLIPRPANACRCHGFFFWGGSSDLHLGYSVLCMSDEHELTVEQSAAKTGARIPASSPPAHLDLDDKASKLQCLYTVLGETWTSCEWKRWSCFDADADADAELGEHTWSSYIINLHMPRSQLLRIPVGSCKHALIYFRLWISVGRDIYQGFLPCQLGLRRLDVRCGRALRSLSYPVTFAVVLNRLVTSLP